MAVCLPFKPPFIAPPLVHTFIDLPCINVPMTVTPFQVPLPFYSLSSHLHFCVPVSKYKYHCGVWYTPLIHPSQNIKQYFRVYTLLSNFREHRLCLKIHSKNSIFCDTKNLQICGAIHDKICGISTFIPQKASKYAALSMTNTGVFSSFLSMTKCAHKL